MSADEDVIASADEDVIVSADEDVIGGGGGVEGEGDSYLEEILGLVRHRRRGCMLCRVTASIKAG